MRNFTLTGPTPRRSHCEPGKEFEEKIIRDLVVNETFPSIALERFDWLLALNCVHGVPECAPALPEEDRERVGDRRYLGLHRGTATKGSRYVSTSFQRTGRRTHKAKSLESADLCPMHFSPHVPNNLD